MLNIKHTVYPEKTIDYNTWIEKIYNRPKQEDLSIKNSIKNKTINCKNSLGYFKINRILTSVNTNISNYLKK